ncbi:MAG: Gfo/Idh/MocA family oxidoreductase, partial [Actinobacteria bacterium]|nr:Gfo/Idh/MocA family oxidoreductase [Actinomycetota bacterium]
AGGAHHGLDADMAAEEAVQRLTDGLGLDQVVITAAAPTNAPLLLASAIARDRGAVVLVGDVPIEAPRAAFYDKELSFVVSRSYGPGRYDAEYEERGLDYPIAYVRWTEKRNMEAVLALEARGSLRLDDVVEEIVDVAEAPNAYARLAGEAKARPRGALVLKYGDVDSSEPAPPAVIEPALAERGRIETRPPVRVALIGPGSFASRIVAPALLAGGARLAVVAGGAGPSAEAAVRTLGFGRVAVTAEDAISDPEVDAVVITTRHGAHASLTARALRAGKHVFCEKPVALTSDELDDVLAAAATAQGILAVGFNRRFSPLLRQMRQHVVHEHGTVVASYRVSAGPLPPEHWLHDLVEGGGRAVGEACHFIDSLAFLADSPIRQIYASGYGAPGSPLQSRDNLALTLTFDNGSVGSIVYAAEGSPRVPKERVELFSGSRSAVLDDYRTLELFGTRRRRISQRAQDKGHTMELAAFLRGAEQGRPPVALDVVANVSLATLAAVESLRTGKAVRIEQSSSG